MIAEEGYLRPPRLPKGQKPKEEPENAEKPKVPSFTAAQTLFEKKDEEIAFKIGGEPVVQKFDPGTAVIQPTSTVEISISCRDLLNRDLLSKSDPLCVVYHRPPGASHWIELLRTETIKDSLNPDFAAKVTIEYRFEEQQVMRFEVYDIDNPAPTLSAQDFLGAVECTLAQIVAAGSASGLSLPLHQATLMLSSPSKDGKEKTAGMIILLAEELASLKDEVTYKLGGRMMGTNWCCIFPPKTYFVISKANPAGGFVVTHRSEVAKGRDPTWSPVTVTLRSLCNGDKDRVLRIECFEIKLGGGHGSIGFCLTSLNKMIALVNGIRSIKLTPDDPSIIPGTIVVETCKVSPIYTFLDYIQTGTQIHCCFAIDFTSSNGDPKDPCSLHYFSTSSNQPNPYEQAIQAVGRIVQDYDDGKLFPVYGFGARIPPNGAVSHNFFVTLTDAGYCYGIPGVLEGYRNCIRRIQLYGPTNFAPVIKHVADLASQNQNGEHYFILLIITDGVITDMPQAKEAIIDASTMPVSIIIVGVGGADYEAMEELDGDAVRITINRKVAARDIVQFVPYRDAYSWMSSTIGPGTKSEDEGQDADPALRKARNDATHKMAQVKLAQEVLAEIPDQLTGYMKSKGIFPNTDNKGEKGEKESTLNTNKGEKGSETNSKNGTNEK